MKKFLPALAIILFFSINAFAQNVELSVQANTLTNGYTGTGAFTNTYLIHNNNTTTVGNPYSDKYTLGYGIAGQAQYMLGTHFFLGAGLGLEDLRGESGIAHVSDYNGDVNNAAGYPLVYSATGKNTFSAYYVDISPYVGFRFKAWATHVDLMPGLDFAFRLYQHSSASATANGTSYSGDYSAGGEGYKDVRARGGIAIWYKRFSFNGSYSYSLKAYNYFDGENNYNIRSNIVRAGIGFRINKDKNLSSLDE